MLVALGAHYAASDGVLAALASNILPVDVRTSGLAFLGSAMGLSQFAASLLFGALWGWKGPTVAVQVFGIGLVIALARFVRAAASDAQASRHASGHETRRRRSHEVVGSGVSGQPRRSLRRA